MEGTGSAGLDVRRYLTVLRRHMVLIVGCTVAVAVVAYAYSSHLTPLYESTAQLLYTPQLNISDPLGQSYVDPSAENAQIDNAVTIMTGPQIAKGVAALTSNSSALGGYTVSTATTSTGVTASTTVDNGLAVTVSSPDPYRSARLANAYAQALVNYSKDSDRASLSAAQAVLSAQLKTVTPSSSDHAVITEDLHDLEILSAMASGDYTLGAPAQPWSIPVSPKPKRSAEMGALFGLVLGIALGSLRERLDTRVRSRQEVSAITGLPIIGRLGGISPEVLARSHLVVTSGADGRASEAIRTLRSNLSYVSLGEENRVLMVMSARQGEGKSLLTSNLAAALALAGKRVALVDADLRGPRIDSIFGRRNILGVSSVVAGLCTLDEALQTCALKAAHTVVVRGDGSTRPATDEEGSVPLTLLTSGPIPPNPAEVVASERFAELVRELATREFDYVLVDAPAFLVVSDATAPASMADGVVLLVNMKLVDRPTLAEARDYLGRLKARKLGVVTVMEPGNGEPFYARLRPRRLSARKTRRAVSHAG